MTVDKPKPKQFFRPITTGTNSTMNQSQFSVTRSKRGKKSLVRGAIGFGFTSHSLKNWRESFEPITKSTNRNRIITFDNHLKTALNVIYDHTPSYYRPVIVITLMYLSTSLPRGFSFSCHGSLQLLRKTNVFPLYKSEKKKNVSSTSDKKFNNLLLTNNNFFRLF